MGDQATFSDADSRIALESLETNMRAGEHRVVELQKVIRTLRAEGRDSREAERQLFLAVSNLGAAVAQRVSMTYGRGALR